MVEQIFNQLTEHYSASEIAYPVSIYFSIDEIKKTVLIDESNCRVEDGRTVDTADCVCKTSAEFFLRVWNDGYKPGMKDFLSGAIKSNNPSVLQSFLIACGKG